MNLFYCCMCYQSLVIFCHMMHSVGITIGWSGQLSCFIVHFAFAAQKFAALLVDRNLIGSLAAKFNLPNVVIQGGHVICFSQPCLKL